MNLKIKVWVDILTLFVLVIAAVLHSLRAFGFDAINWLTSKTSRYSVYPICVIFAISALLHVLSRDYYLPFLGSAAFPCGSLVEKEASNADNTVTVQVKPNSSVIYWAAEENDSTQPNPWTAYGKYTNAGVAQSDGFGTAVLKIRKPSSYNIPMIGSTKRPHVHYRECTMPGLLGRVQTVYL